MVIFSRVPHEQALYEVLAVITTVVPVISTHKNG